MTLIGVRSSWDIVDTNSDLMRLACPSSSTKRALVRASEAICVTPSMSRRCWRLKRLSGSESTAVWMAMMSSPCRRAPCRRTPAPSGAGNPAGSATSTLSSPRSAARSGALQARGACTGAAGRACEGEDHRDRRIRGRRGGQVERHRVPEDGETRDAHHGQLRPRTPRQEGRRRRGEDDEEERGRREVAGENAGRRGRDADLDRDREGDRNTPPPASGLAEHPEGPEDGAELHAFEGVERKELRAIERQLGQRKQDEREQQDPQPGSDASDE